MATHSDDDHFLSAISLISIRGIMTKREEDALTAPAPPAFDPYAPQYPQGGYGQPPAPMYPPGGYQDQPAYGQPYQAYQPAGAQPNWATPVPSGDPRAAA